MFKNKGIILSAAIAVILVLLLVVPALAYSYIATITLTETGGITYPLYPWTLTVDNAYMAQKNFISPSGLDVSISVDGVAAAPMVVADKTLFPASLTASTVKSATMTFGNTPAASMPIIAGPGGYVTTTHDNALEPAALDFEMGWNGYVRSAIPTSTYTTGLADFTYNSTAVAGDAATVWAVGMIGQWIKPDADSMWYQIHAVPAVNLITLENPYRGHYRGAVAYTIGTLDVLQDKSGAIQLSMQNDASISATLGAYGTTQQEQAAGGTNYTVIFGAGNAAAMIFTASDSYQVAGMGIYGSAGAVSSATIHLFDTLAGAPTGASLASGVTGGMGAAAWYPAYFYNPYQLVSGHVYALVVIATTSDIVWEYSAGAGGYTTVAYPGGWGAVAQKFTYRIYLDFLEFNDTITTGYHEITVGRIGTDNYASIDTVLIGAFVDPAVTIYHANNGWLLYPCPYISEFYLSTGVTFLIDYKPEFMIGVSTYSAGTATFTQGSTAVLGIGTTFTNAMVGSLIKVHTDTTYYIIAGFTDATHITLDRAYTPVTTAGDLYNIVPNKVQDLDGYDHIGTITFVANPGTVAVATTSFASGYQPVINAATDSDAVRDTLPEVGVSDWFVDPDIPDTLIHNPLRSLITMVSDNTTLTEIQVWRFFGLVLVLFVLVLSAKSVNGHYLITGIATGAAIAVCVVWTVWPLWALVFVIAAVLGGIIAERMQSV